MSKYGAVKTTVDNIVFDSKREAKRYADLKLLLRAGKIQNLTVQPEFDFWLENENVFTYRADFCYYENGKLRVEDVKGFKTPVYRLKKKLIEAKFKIKIMET